MRFRRAAQARACTRPATLPTGAILAMRAPLQWRIGPVTMARHQAALPRQVPMSRPAHLIGSSAAVVVSLSISAACWLAYPAPAWAQGAPTLAGKNVQMLIGFGPGGGYDLWAAWSPAISASICRAIPRWCRRTCRAPAASWPPTTSTISPQGRQRDGHHRARRGLGADHRAPGRRFDPTRITWLGTPTTETKCLHRLQYRQGEDPQGSLHDGIDRGRHRRRHRHPFLSKALSALLGMSSRSSPAFPASSDVFLAMERGEVDGICESLDSVRASGRTGSRARRSRSCFRRRRPQPATPGRAVRGRSGAQPDDRLAIEFLYAGQGIGRPFVAPPDMRRTAQRCCAMPSATP